jgi:hypothetical protein
MTSHCTGLSGARLRKVGDKMERGNGSIANKNRKEIRENWLGKKVSLIIEGLDTSHHGNIIRNYGGHFYIIGGRREGYFFVEERALKRDANRIPPEEAYQIPLKRVEINEESIEGIFINSLGAEQNHPTKGEVKGIIKKLE